MHHSPGFISPSRNLSCLATMCCLLPVIGRVSGGYWWLTNWASEAQSWVSCPARVGWFLAYDWDADLFRLCDSQYLRPSVPWLDMGGSNPWLRILGAIQHLRGLNPWPRVLEATLQPTVPYGNSSCDLCWSWRNANIIACVSPSSSADACSCAASAASLRQDCLAKAAKYWHLLSHFSMK